MLLYVTAQDIGWLRASETPARRPRRRRGTFDNPDANKRRISKSLVARKKLPQCHSERGTTNTVCSPTQILRLL